MPDMLLPHLMIGDSTERVCVRVARLWELRNPDDETELLHTDMVLVDEEGNSMHAQAYPPAGEQIKEMIKEGSIYNICYFRVRKCGNYKPVDTDMMMFFSKWTKVEEVVQVPPAFPKLVYTLASMEQIQSRMEKMEMFTDVIGIITSVSSVEHIQTRMRAGESLSRNVMIRLPSGAPLKIVLWGEGAASFPAEEVHKDGQSSPQIVIFVGTLVKRYGGLSLSGGPSCKWYINPQVPEAEALMNSARVMHQPVSWADGSCSSQAKVAAQEKKISVIKKLNPFECKKNEFLVTVTIKKIDKSWWYNACKKCVKTAKHHGDSYKCTNPACGAIGTPVQRYKLCILAGDETGDTDFIAFGRIGQQLTKKTADALLASNPPGFIPDAIIKLLERTFIWNVSFTDSTIESGTVTFQVNSVVAAVDDGSTIIPSTPAGSQSSSFMLSKGASPSMQSTPGISNPLPLSSLPAASDASLASSATPTKPALLAPESLETPQKNATADEDDTVTSAAGMPADVPDRSSTKNQKSASKKRTRRSPDKKVAKALFPGKEAGDGADDLGSGGRCCCWGQPRWQFMSCKSRVPFAAPSCSPFRRHVTCVDTRLQNV